MRILLWLSLASMLSGCAVVGNLGQLEVSTPEEADNFHTALAIEYLAYSESEHEQSHYYASEYFAGKGLKALRGEEVPPEPVNLGLSGEERKKNIASRLELISLLTQDVKEAAAQKAARAQMLFDCLQQQERRDVPEAKREKAPCEDEFTAALGDLQAVGDSFIEGEETHYAIGFAPGRDTLGAAAQKTLMAVAKHVPDGSRYAISLEAGPADSELTKKRVASIRNALSAQGISPVHVHLLATSSDKAVLLSNDVKPPVTNQIRITLVIEGGAQ